MCTDVHRCACGVVVVVQLTNCRLLYGMAVVFVGMG
jgi:hypothetical protein